MLDQTKKKQIRTCWTITSQKLADKEGRLHRLCPTFLLFWAPLCLVVGAKKYFFGALYKNSEDPLFGTAGTVWRNDALLGVLFKHFFFILCHHFHEGDI